MPGLDWQDFTCLRTVLGAERPAYRSEDRLEHWHRQSACVRIVARAMIAGSNGVGFQHCCVAVAEGMSFDPPAERPNGAVMGNLSKRHDRRQLRQRFDAVFQKLATGVDLWPNRFVLWGDAAHSVRDHAVLQLQCVVWSSTELSGREAVFDQCTVQQIPSKIPGERAACPVCTPDARGETNDK